MRFSFSTSRLPAQKVLIVDPSDDSREVLRTMLERRGLQIFEAANTESGLDWAREYHPDLMIVDADADSDASDNLSDQARRDNAYVVMLSSVRLPTKDERNSRQTHVVAKPYHYGPLIRKIETLLKQLPASSQYRK